MTHHPIWYIVVQVGCLTLKFLNIQRSILMWETLKIVTETCLKRQLFFNNKLDMDYTENGYYNFINDNYNL